MTTHLELSDLAPPPYRTRSKGEVAYHKLSAFLGYQIIEIDLDKAETLSMSFLDDIISSLVGDSVLDRVTFKTDSNVTRDKLSRIAEIHSIDIYYRSSANAERTPVPRLLISRPRPAFVKAC